MQFEGESATGDREALDRVLAGAHGVRVHEMRGDSTPLLEERDPVAVQALRAALRIADLPGFVCMCSGDVALDFLDASGTALTRVTLHHGFSVRWDGWGEDALLADGERSLEWLAVRGITGPLRELRASEHRRAEADRVERLWIADIPGPLAAFTAQFLDTSHTGTELNETQLREVCEILLENYSNPVDRILRLFVWNASGTGKNTGYPVHEDIPAQILDRENRVDFAQAVEQADSRALAGAIRYLLSWDTRKRVGGLLAVMSPGARDRLLAHTRGDRNRDWLARRIARLD